MSKADEYCERENIAPDAQRDKRGAIKDYLEKKRGEDSALAEKYKPELMDGCMEFIEDVARKWLGGSSGAIEDAIVYKWARDYFIDGYAEAEEKPRPAVNEGDAESADDEPEREDEECGDVLGSREETKPAIVSKKPASGQPGERSLFDFGDGDA